MVAGEVHAMPALYGTKAVLSEWLNALLALAPGTDLPSP